MVEIMEIWANDARTEFAAKISGDSFFVITTSPDVKYTHVIYAAPYLGRRGSIKDVRGQLRPELERQRQRYENNGKLDWNNTYTE